MLRIISIVTPSYISFVFPITVDLSSNTNYSNLYNQTQRNQIAKNCILSRELLRVKCYCELQGSVSKPSRHEFCNKFSRAGKQLINCEIVNKLKNKIYTVIEEIEHAVKINILFDYVPGFR